MELELKERLTPYPELSGYLQDIKQFCADIDHSEEIISLLGQILKPIENHPQFLNEHELFILLASAYLHDIGMQCLKTGGVAIDKLTKDEHEEIRKRHAGRPLSRMWGRPTADTRSAPRLGRS